MGFFSSTWLSFWYPKVNAALQRLAIYLKPNTAVIMSYDSAKTVELLGLVLETLKTSRATAADAKAREKAALAAIEPLRAENSRFGAAIAQLEANIAAYESNDAAEDAALKAVVDFIESGEEPPVEDPTPVIPGLEDGEPPTSPPADPSSDGEGAAEDEVVEVPDSDVFNTEPPAENDKVEL
jgi:hypothetical protein